MNGFNKEGSEQYKATNQRLKTILISKQFRGPQLVDSLRLYNKKKKLNPLRA